MTIIKTQIKISSYYRINVLQWQKQRQRSIPSIPIMPVVQELPRKQRKKKEVVKEVDSSF